MKLSSRLTGGIGAGVLALSMLAAPVDTNSTGLESRVAAAEAPVKNTKQEEFKEDYTFDEVKAALGEKYAKLTDEQKKTVEKNFNSQDENIRFAYHTCIGILYSKEGIESLKKEESDEQVKDFSKFKISELKKGVLEGYLAAFPWIKKEDIAKIDKDPRNPDRVLIYFTEFSKDLDESLSGLKALNAIDQIDGLIRSYFSDQKKDKK